MTVEKQFSLFDFKTILKFGSIYDYQIQVQFRSVSFV